MLRGAGAGRVGRKPPATVRPRACCVCVVACQLGWGSGLLRTAAPRNRGVQLLCVAAVPKPGFERSKEKKEREKRNTMGCVEPRGARASVCVSARQACRRYATRCASSASDRASSIVTGAIGRPVRTPLK